MQELAAGWGDLIPPHISVFGENMGAVHSIEYDALTSPFYLFGGERIRLMRVGRLNACLCVQVDMCMTVCVCVYIVNACVSICTCACVSGVS